MKNPHWEKVDWLSIVKNEMKAYEQPTLEEFDEIWHVNEDGSINYKHITFLLAKKERILNEDIDIKRKSPARFDC